MLELRAEGTNGQAIGKIKHVSSSKSFESIKKYNGKVENFFSWKYNVEMYLEKE